jgi:hypothetical protein
MVIILLKHGAVSNRRALNGLTAQEIVTTKLKDRIDNVKRNEYEKILDLFQTVIRRSTQIIINRLEILQRPQSPLLILLPENHRVYGL